MGDYGLKFDTRMDRMETIIIVMPMRTAILPHIRESTSNLTCP